MSSLGFFAFLIPIGIILVNLICAFGIWSNTGWRDDNGKPIRLLSPIPWAILGLICGLPALALYWAVHYLAVEVREPS